jgi:hypothetical protein
MADDQLTQELLNRQPQAPQGTWPNISLADVGSKLAGGMINVPADLLKGVAGVQEPGNVSQLIGNMATILPTDGLISSLLKFQKVGEPTAALVQMLHGYKPQQDEQILANTSKYLRVPQELRGSTMVNRMEGRMPDLSGLFKYEKDMTQSRPSGFSQMHRQQNAGNGPVNRARQFEDALANLPPDIDITANQLSPEMDMRLPSDKGPVKLTTTTTGASSRLKQAQSALAKSGLTEDDVRLIRNLPVGEARRRYPNLSETKVREINKRLAFNHIRD